MNPRALLALVVCLTGCFSPNAAQEADIAARRSRLQTAEAMFQERCKKAGVTIHRTVENVEGVLLMKLRPRKDNYDDQFALDDPYGRDLGGEAYIQTFLRGSYQANTRGTPAPGSPPRLGYLYVEAVDFKDGKRYRYTGSVKAVGRKDVTAENVRRALAVDPAYDLNIYAYVLDKVPAPDPAPRYGVTYDDISTREEREYWIAGSSLRVIDLNTHEVMAERIGYMMDRGQGSDAGGRLPWLLAADHACPAFAPRHGATSQMFKALDFTESVLKPKLEK
ncbi:MAG TPA: hypothetical protein PLR37_14530 [Candidatus Accumulibacter phosphatis]|jgi:hypothetical protein|nr:hypothetical protein [Candidatus Accumulibacter phosphatis]